MIRGSQIAGVYLKRKQRAGIRTKLPPRRLFFDGPFSMENERGDCTTRNGAAKKTWLFPCSDYEHCAPPVFVRRQTARLLHGKYGSNFHFSSRQDRDINSQKAARAAYKATQNPFFSLKKGFWAKKIGLEAKKDVFLLLFARAGELNRRRTKKNKPTPGKSK